MKCNYRTQRLTLAQPFGISREVSSEKWNTFVFMDEGIGEAAPSAYYGESFQSVEAALPTLFRAVEKHPDDLDLALDCLEKCLPENTAAKAAVDMALYDRLGKRLGRPLYSMWNLSSEKTPLTSFTIGLDSEEKMLDKVRGAEVHPIVKIKMGTPNDIGILRQIRSITSKPIRVDANGGWNLEEAMRNLDAMVDLNIELVEQPLPAEQASAMKQLHRHSKIPLIADESCRTCKDIPALVGRFDGINIKLMKCGGLREALRMITAARKHDLSVMIGCMIESSVADTASAHLTPLADYADLDGHLLINNDPYVGMTVRNGKIILPDEPGIGVREK